MSQWIETRVKKAVKHVWKRVDATTSKCDRCGCIREAEYGQTYTYNGGKTYVPCRGG